MLRHSVLPVAWPESRCCSWEVSPFPPALQLAISPSPVSSAARPAYPAGRQRTTEHSVRSRRTSIVCVPRWGIPVPVWLNSVHRLHQGRPKYGPRARIEKMFKNSSCSFWVHFLSINMIVFEDKMHSISFFQFWWSTSLTLEKAKKLLEKLWAPMALMVDWINSENKIFSFVEPSRSRVKPN